MTKIAIYIYLYNTNKHMWSLQDKYRKRLSDNNIMLLKYGSARSWNICIYIVVLGVNHSLCYLPLSCVLRHS